MSAPTLGVVMIVKNEEDNLPRILADIQGFADEIVVVDTGSTDRTVEIAETAGARMGHFAWCDDFGAARNASIELARADYLLWLDADDRIDPPEQEKLRRLKPLLRPQQDAAFWLTLINEVRDDEDNRGSQLRIFPRRVDVRFEGPIHEQVLPSIARAGLPTSRLDITIRHTGYTTREVLEGKGRRNLQILLAQLESGKDDGNLHFQIARTLYSIREYERALEHMQKALKKGVPTDTYPHAVRLLADTFIFLGRPDEAVDATASGLRQCPQSGYMYNFHAHALLQAGRFAEAAEAFARAEDLGLELGQCPLPATAVEKMHFLHGHALDRCGRPEEAVQCFRQALGLHPDWPPALKQLGLVLLRQGDAATAAGHLERFIALHDGHDRAATLALARACLNLGRIHDARRLAGEALSRQAGDREALACLARTAILLEDMDGLAEALEQLMNLTGMDTDREVGSTAELAAICAETGLLLLQEGHIEAARHLVSTAFTLDEACAEACLLEADLRTRDQDLATATTWLEQALKNGADPATVLPRMEHLAGAMAGRQAG